MRKTEIWQCLFSCLIVFSFSACAGASDVGNNEIDQQEAIDIATEMASMSMPPEISGSQVAPSNVSAEKMTLGEAAQRINANDSVPSEYSLAMPVWLVSMDGIWLPATVPDLPTPEPYRRLSIIIDAKTGQEIMRNLQP